VLESERTGYSAIFTVADQAMKTLQASLVPRYRNERSWSPLYLDARGLPPIDANAVLTARMVELLYGWCTKYFSGDGRGDGRVR